MQSESRGLRPGESLKPGVVTGGSHRMGETQDYWLSSKHGVRISLKDDVLVVTEFNVVNDE